MSGKGKKKPSKPPSILSKQNGRKKVLHVITERKKQSTGDIYEKAILEIIHDPKKMNAAIIESEKQKAASAAESAAESAAASALNTVRFAEEIKSAPKFFPLRPPSTENSFFKIWDIYNSEKLARSLSDNTLTKLLAFIIVRAKHTIAELAHDFGLKNVIAMLNNAEYITRLINVLLSYISDEDIIIITKNSNAATARTAIVDDIKNFFGGCNSDATAKKMVLTAIDTYLSTYENISSLNSLGSEPYSSEGTDAAKFYKMIYDRYDKVSGVSGNIAFYLDAQHGNFLKDYHASREKGSSKNTFCKDLAYIVDPGSGWLPGNLYTEKATILAETFFAKYTGLGRDLHLISGPLNSKNVPEYIKANWAGSPYIYRIYQRSNSVDASIELIQRLKLYSEGTDRPLHKAAIDAPGVLADIEGWHTWPIGDPRFIDLIIDSFYLKTAGDRIQNESINSDIWVDLNNNNMPLEISNDYLCIWDSILYRGRGIVQTGSGYYRFFAGEMVNITCTNQELINFAVFFASFIRSRYTNPSPEVTYAEALQAAAELNIASLISTFQSRNSSLIFGEYATYLIEQTKIKATSYFTKSFELIKTGQLPIYEKKPVTAGAIEPFIMSETEIFSISPGGTKAKKLMAAALTFFIDTIEKFNILERIDDKGALLQNIVANLYADFTALPDKPLSGKYKPLIPSNISSLSDYIPVNMYTFTELFGIFTQKESYSKLTLAFSAIEFELVNNRDIKTEVPRYIIYTEILKNLKNSVSSVIPYNSIAFLLTFIIYDIGQQVPAERGVAAADSAREKEKRAKWISACTTIPSVRPDSMTEEQFAQYVTSVSALRNFIIRMLFGMLKGSFEVTSPIVASDGVTIAAGVYTINGRDMYDAKGNSYTPTDADLANIYNRMTITGTYIDIDYVTAYQEVKNMGKIAPVLFNLLAIINFPILSALDNTTQPIIIENLIEAEPYVDLIFNNDREVGEKYRTEKEELKELKKIEASAFSRRGIIETKTGLLKIRAGKYKKKAQKGGEGIEIDNGEYTGPPGIWSSLLDVLSEYEQFLDKEPYTDVNKENNAIADQIFNLFSLALCLDPRADGMYGLAKLSEFISAVNNLPTQVSADINPLGPLLTELLESIPVDIEPIIEYVNELSVLLIKGTPAELAAAAAMSRAKTPVAPVKDALRPQQSSKATQLTQFGVSGTLTDKLREEAAAEAVKLRSAAGVSNNGQTVSPSTGATGKRVQGGGRRTHKKRKNRKTRKLKNRNMILRRRTIRKSK